MKLIRYLQTFFGTDAAGNSRPVFEAGRFYAPHDASESHIVQGFAEAVDAPPDADKADDAADKALDKAVKAFDAANAADALAKAAHAAADLAAADPNAPPDGIDSGNPTAAPQDAAAAADAVQASAPAA